MTASFKTETNAAPQVSDRTIIYPPELADEVFGREDQVMAAIGLRAVEAISAKALQLPSKVVIGRFSSREYDEFFENEGYGIALWPLPTSRIIENYHPAWRSFPPVESPLTVSAPGKTVTFGGSVTPGINIAVYTGQPQAATVFTTTLSGSPSVVATSVADALVDLGITATAFGNVVTADRDVSIRIGSKGAMWRESSKIQQHIQISVWSGIRSLRNRIGDVLRSSIGTLASPRIGVDNLSDAWVKYVGNRSMDDDELNSLWVYHLIVSAQYAIIETQDAYPVLLPRVSLTINDVPPPALIPLLRVLPPIPLPTTPTHGDDDDMPLATGTFSVPAGAGGTNLQGDAVASSGVFSTTPVRIVEIANCDSADQSAKVALFDCTQVSQISTAHQICSYQVGDGQVVPRNYITVNGLCWAIQQGKEGGTALNPGAGVDVAYANP